MLDKHPEHGKAGHHRLFGRADHPRVAGQIAVAADATEADTAVHAGLRIGAGADFDGLKRDVVAVADGRNRAAVVEGDIELARQGAQLARIEHQIRQAPCKRGQIDQLTAVEPRRRGRRHIARGVGAGALAGQTCRGQRIQNVEHMPGFDFPDL